MELFVGDHCDVREGLLAVADDHAQAAARWAAQPGAGAGHPGADLREAVHGVRLAIKRLRAILHLILPVTDEAFARQAIDRLRDAAALLAPQRDADIAREALAALLEEETTLAQRVAIGAALERLGPAKTSGAAKFSTRGAMQYAVQTVCGIVEELRRAPWSAADWDSLAPGLRRSWVKLGAAFDAAQGRAEDEDFHQWRKLVKRTQFQIELLRPLWPKRLRAMGKVLRQLGDQLGDDHDLIVLRQHLMRQTMGLPGVGGARHIAPVMQVIEAKSSRLRVECRAMGLELGALKPKHFFRRLERRYHARHGTPTPAPEPLAA